MLIVESVHSKFQTFFPMLAIGMMAAILVLRLREREHAAPRQYAIDGTLVFQVSRAVRALTVLLIVGGVLYGMRSQPRHDLPFLRSGFALVCVMLGLWSARDAFTLRMVLSESGIKVARALWPRTEVRWADVVEVRLPFFRYRFECIDSKGRRAWIPVNAPGVRRVLFECRRSVRPEVAARLEFLARTILGPEQASGRCPRCGYLVGRMPRCSECGLPLVGVAPGPTSMA